MHFKWLAAVECAGAAKMVLVRANRLEISGPSLSSAVDEKGCEALYFCGTALQRHCLCQACRGRKRIAAPLVLPTRRFSLADSRRRRGGQRRSITGACGTAVKSRPV